MEKAQNSTTEPVPKFHRVMATARQEMSPKRPSCSRAESKGDKVTSYNSQMAAYVIDQLAESAQGHRAREGHREEGSYTRVS